MGRELALQDRPCSPIPFLLNLQFLHSSISRRLETLLGAYPSQLSRGQFWGGVQQFSLKLPEGEET